MVCYKPLQAFYVVDQVTGERSPLRFDFGLNARESNCQHVEVPCGQCIGCRLDRSQMWAMRIVHEAQMHDKNSFVTLTYSPENLPKNRSLNVEDFQLFMKRLRKRIEPIKVRYFTCGEYGENNHRPHYHICLFGYDFPDKVYHRGTSDQPLYTSQELDSLWTYGFSLIGRLNFQTASYVARYCVKKVTGKAAKSWYGDRKPEFALMSRKPGLGREWYDKYSTDCFPSDYLIVEGRPVPVPRYYDELYRLDHPDLFRSIKERRVVNASERAEDCTRERLAVREICHRAKLNLFLTRDME